MRSNDRDIHPPHTSLTGRLVAAAAVCATAFALAAPAQAVGLTSHAAAVKRPAAVTGGQGATVPFTTYEAENAATNGTVVGPDYTQGTVASEASGRKAVQLSGQGQYVEFTLTAPANAVDVSYNLPQGSSGSLAVYVNGTRISQTLPVTSKYSYLSTGNIVGSKTHHLFDDSRLLLGQNLSSGAKVRVQVDPDSGGGPFTIDTAQFEQVAAAGTQPANSVSVTADGADPSGQGDSTGAFDQAITDARSAGQGGVDPAGHLQHQLPAAGRRDHPARRGRLVLRAARHPPDRHVQRAGQRPPLRLRRVRRGQHPQRQLAGQLRQRQPRRRTRWSPASGSSTRSSACG